MRIAALIARVLLGLAFVVFGLNGFLHFIHEPPPKNPLAGQFFGALVQSNWYIVIFACQFVGGLLMLSGFYVPLGLCILAPVIVNILCYHLFMEPGSIAPGLVVAILWLIVFYSVRSAFAGILQPKTPLSAPSAQPVP